MIRAGSSPNCHRPGACGKPASRRTIGSHTQSTCPGRERATAATKASPRPDTAPQSRLSSAPISCSAPSARPAPQAINPSTSGTPRRTRPEAPALSCPVSDFACTGLPARSTLAGFPALAAGGETGMNCASEGRRPSSPAMRRRSSSRAERERRGPGGGTVSCSFPAGETCLEQGGRDAATDAIGKSPESLPKDFPEGPTGPAARPCAPPRPAPCSTSSTGRAGVGSVLDLSIAPSMPRSFVLFLFLWIPDLQTRVKQLKFHKGRARMTPGLAMPR